MRNIFCSIISPNYKPEPGMYFKFRLNILNLKISFHNIQSFYKVWFLILKGTAGFLLLEQIHKPFLFIHLTRKTFELLLLQQEQECLQDYSVYDTPTICQQVTVDLCPVFNTPIETLIYLPNSIIFIYFLFRVKYWRSIY